MANRKHREILRKGVREWNSWRRANPNVTPDLFGANLNGANLSGANLSGANLIGANLSEANFSGAKLSGCEGDEALNKYSNSC